MREPTIRESTMPVGTGTPYSQLPTSWLREVIRNEIEHTNPGSSLPPDADFRRRYAAILLAERGQ